LTHLSDLEANVSAQKQLLNSVENLANWEEEWDMSATAINAIASNFNPHLIQQAEDSIEYIEDRSSEIAQGMLDDDEDNPDELAMEMVNNLMEAQTHGKSINIEEAEDIGLNVFDLRPSEYSELWDNIWEYYLRTASYVREDINAPATVMDTCNETLVFVS